MKQPHIAIICASCGGSGSVASVAIHHANELARYFRVTLLSNSFPDQKHEDVTYSKVYPRRFDALRRFSHVPNEYSFALSVKKKLSLIYHADSLDMIMCHSHVVASLAAIKLKKRYGIPYALISHGYIFDRPKGTYDVLLTTLYRLSTPPAHRYADLTIALSPYMKACALKAGSCAKTIHLIPNGIDPEDIGLANTTDNFKEAAKKFKMLYVGWFSKIKGIEILINACKALQDNKIDFTLKLIGSGPLENDIRKIVFRFGLSDQIQFIGPIQRNLLANYYQTSNIVCVPSINEALPTVILESLISGTPVIGSDIDAISFLVNHGENGMLFPAGDEKALACAVIKLYNEPALLNQLAKQAKASIWPKFSWANVGVLLRNYVNEILSKKEIFN